MKGFSKEKFLPAVFGVAVATFVMVTASTLLQGFESAPPPPALASIEAEVPVDPESFVTAWARSETNTYAATGTYEFETAENQETVPYFRAQTSELRLERQGDSANLTDSTGTQVCDLLVNTWGCSARRLVAPIEARAQGIRQLVTGSDRAYALSVEVGTASSADCFKLTAVAEAEPTARFGSQATFCFDSGTGAVVRSETKREQRTERLVVEEIRAEVSADDFVLPNE